MAELTADSMEAMAEEAAEAAGLAGTETLIPAEVQIPARAGVSTACSSALQALGIQPASDSAILAWPVVHWQVTSVELHPEAGRAAIKQGRAHWGRPERSCAPVKASEAAKATMVAWKRMFASLTICVCEYYNEGSGSRSSGDVYVYITIENGMVDVQETQECKQTREGEGTSRHLNTPIHPIPSRPFASPYPLPRPRSRRRRRRM